MKRAERESKFDIMAEFQSGLRIDKNSLDDELIRQPEIFYRVAALHARALADRDSLKVEVEKAEAELYNQFRVKASKSDEKATKDSLQAQVDQSPRMVDLRAQHLEAANRATIMYAMKEAYSSRAYVLKDLVALYLGNYFTTESGGKRRGEIMDKTAERNREETGRLRQERRERRDTDD